MCDNCKDVAISFAKYICKTKLSKQVGDLTDMDGKPIIGEYWPEEFQIILNELLERGDRIYDLFINISDNDGDSIPTGELSCNVQDVLE